MYTFEEFRETAVEVSDLGAKTGNSLHDGVAGIVYHDEEGCAIGQIEVDGDMYRVHAERAEIATVDRAEAERWLWIHWSSHEISDPDNEAAYELANMFSELLRAALSGNLEEVVHRNRAETNPNICHSHDFCDANQVMLDAYVEVYGNEPDMRSDDVEVMGYAWDEAKLREFQT